MSIQLPDEVLDQLDRGALPVRMEDPRSHVEYVLIKKQEYDLLRDSDKGLSTSPEGDDGILSEWNETLNARRIELVNQEIDGTLTAEEAVELQDLQNKMLAFRRKVAPYPLEELRELHQQLLEKAHQTSRGD
ncbi:MAG: hypothetical protein ACKVP0_16470 [Pirellulaceae bacterium]